MGSLRHSPTPILRPIFRTLSERPTVKQDKDLLGQNVLSKCLLFYIYIMTLASKRILNNAYLALLLMFSTTQFRTNIPATTDAKTRGETKAPFRADSHVTRRVQSLERGESSSAISSPHYASHSHLKCYCAMSKSVQKSKHWIPYLEELNKFSQQIYSNE